MTNSERVEIGVIFAVTFLVFLLGVAILGFGREAGYVFHGWLIAIVAGWGLMNLINRLNDTRPDIPHEYSDTVIKWGVGATFIWGVIGFTIGDILAWQLAIPSWNGDMSWSNFGRIRPMHTTAVIFGFGGNALMATSFYVVQRTSRARLASEVSPWFVFFGYNLFVLLAVTGYPMGITQSKEYAEPEWYADLVLTFAWVCYLWIYMRTLANRAEPHIYVANWYYMGFIVVIAMLHVVNNLAMPVSIAYPKSYSLFSGVQDAMTQWWYGHNAVGFLLTAGFLGMMYYFLPKAVNRPIYSYPPVDHRVLGYHLPVPLGRVSPPALHGAARLGAVSWYDHVSHPAGAQLGVGVQRDPDHQRCLGQGAHRSRRTLHDGRDPVLWTGDIRGVLPRHSSCKHAQPLHRLDCGSCARGRAGLGRLHQLWGDVQDGAMDLEAGRHLFTAP